jgi:hypothetical protein
VQLFRRIIEGLLVTFVSALALVLFKSHIVLALIVAIVVCVVSLLIVISIEHRVSEKAKAKNSGRGLPASELTPKPNFTIEITNARTLLESFSGTDEEKVRVRTWIDEVYAKLLKWSPRAAATFKPVKLPVTKESREAVQQHMDRLIPPVVRQLLETTPKLKLDPDAQKLYDHLERLIKLTSPTTATMKTL